MNPCHDRTQTRRNRALQRLASLALIATVGGPLAACQAASELPPKESSMTQRFGFLPPPPGAFVTQALVTWVNRKTGERFVAPTGGWQPPDANWAIEDPSVPSAGEPARRSGTSR